jgi:predicted NBD/HSP70 family sugar kinase
MGGGLVVDGRSHTLHAHDVGCVILGGSAAQIGEPLLQSARRSLQQHGHMTVAETPLAASVLGPQAQLVGAAAYARQSTQVRKYG